MESSELTFYLDLLGDIKSRVRTAQARAARAANAEMLRLYWDIGRLIAERQRQEGWGAAVIPRLAVDLRNELPEEKGFSTSNLKRMVQFSEAYPGLFSIGARVVPQLQLEELQSSVSDPQHCSPLGALSVPQSEEAAGKARKRQVAVTLLPWAHNILLMQKLKDLPTRLWYAERAVAQGWSRDMLAAQIRSRLHERQGTTVANFSATLPEAHAQIALGLLKDPYLFDFLTLDEPFHERELEAALVAHIQQFLLELGQGFAFVGRQYRLTVSDRDFHLDLLFYHLRLRCFVVVDLKKGEFQPEHAGKMNFYCSAVDDQLRHPNDNPTIGLILCQDKDRIFAEYALRDVHKPIGVADYELTRSLPGELASALPSIEQIEQELAGQPVDEE
ncbi:MAG: DUF1016 family protein [Candidatus Sumerlaeia bacterium]|nr:DUF1016 family protein [Candidatus Sumerlaeia bacterium]